MHNPRTYGKRANMKRKDFPTSSSSKLEPMPSMEELGSAQKRRKVTASPEPPKRSLSPTRTVSDNGSDVPKKSTQPKTLKVYGTPRKSAARTLSDEHVSKTPVRDLSQIFDSVLPSSSQQSPSKLAKRMLARSKTESSIESAASQEPSIERTTSLPVLPPSPSKPDRQGSTSNLSTPAIRPVLQKAKSSVTKTYAGSFRSFLVPVSTSQGPGSSQSAIPEEDDFESRESYNSLRTRWGVDNSEDDPYPAPLTPTKSQTATPEGSPSKRSRGKAAMVQNLPSNGMINPLKSISELRNKGESRRFLDEVGYLFEGMSPRGSISLRRASALEIITKMCDVDFMRKAKAADFFNRTWDIFLAAECGSGKDKILDILLIIFIAIISHDEDSLQDLNQHTQATPDDLPSQSKENTESLVDILFQQLEVSQDADDPLQLLPQIDDMSLRNAGLTKRDRPILMSINDVLTTKSALVSSGSSISTSSLAAHSLRRIPLVNIPRRYFPTLLDSFRAALSSGTDSTSLFSALPKWTTTAQVVSYANVHSYLYMFTNYLLDKWKPYEESDSTADDQQDHNQHEIDKARDEWLVEDLVALAVCIELRMLSHRFDDDDELDDIPLQESMDLLLQAFVSLTHNDKDWGRKFVESQYGLPFLLRMVHKSSRKPSPGGIGVKKEEDEDELDLINDENDGAAPSTEQNSDTLCLVLGLLTNLVQTTPQSKDLLRDTLLDPSCRLKRHACGIKCSCPKRCTGLDILIDLYERQTKVESLSSSTKTPPPDSKEAEAEAEASFIRSHLAVLFGLLMMDNPKNRKEILSKLPRPPSSSTQQAKVSMLFDQAQLFLTFYTIVSSRLKEGDSESRVAKEVVEFLETLRNSPDSL